MSWYLYIWLMFKQFLLEFSYASEYVFSMYSTDKRDILRLDKLVKRVDEQILIYKKRLGDREENFIKMIENKIEVIGQDIRRTENVIRQNTQTYENSRNTTEKRDAFKQRFINHKHLTILIRKQFLLGESSRYRRENAITDHYLTDDGLPTIRDNKYAQLLADTITTDITQYNMDREETTDTFDKFTQEAEEAWKQHLTASL